jgi:hypothetical protein
MTPEMVPDGSCETAQVYLENRECLSLKAAKIKRNRKGKRVFFGWTAVRFLTGPVEYDNQVENC